jgi:hypothetical protein
VVWRGAAVATLPCSRTSTFTLVHTQPGDETEDRDDKKMLEDDDKRAYCEKEKGPFYENNVAIPGTGPVPLRPDFHPAFALLMNHRGFATSTNEEGDTLLHAAVLANDVAAAKKLLASYRVDPSVASNNAGLTPLVAITNLVAKDEHNRRQMMSLFDTVVDFHETVDGLAEGLLHEGPKFDSLRTLRDLSRR